jgi:hypothetical protein
MDNCSSGIAGQGGVVLFSPEAFIYSVLVSVQVDMY